MVQNPSIICSVLRADSAIRTFVAFSAGLTHHVDLAENASVAFDRVWTNTGDGYDSNTGIFTCPHTGVYVFIYHGLTERNGQMWLEFFKNNAYEMSGFAHNNAYFAYASNSVTLPLIDGDQVYIRGHGSSQLFGEPHEIYATFSGFMLIPNHGQRHS
ncbi:complement C1q-like protein 3 [Mercenaria mercenaria]|uniref:complement C1q-like protein 3 n=1 Tax=Mercenaria mercenaria TaxID=6596 RepID=UPI00234E3EEE|nr:complement C1q-like protein 3 [Mercenaria mercenaria]